MNARKKSLKFYRPEGDSTNKKFIDFIDKILGLVKYRFAY